MKPLEIMLKHYKPAGPPPEFTPELQAVIDEYPTTKLFLGGLADILGPCDITVIEERKAEPPGAAVLLKLVYAYNQYTGRINKAEEYFKMATPEQAAKFQPVYNELVVKASATLNEIREIRSNNQFDVYTYQETPEGYIKLFNYKGKEVILQLAA